MYFRRIRKNRRRKIIMAIKINHKQYRVFFLMMTRARISMK